MRISDADYPAVFAITNFQLILPVVSESIIRIMDFDIGFQPEDDVLSSLFTVAKIKPETMSPD